MSEKHTILAVAFLPVLEFCLDTHEGEPRRRQRIGSTLSWSRTVEILAQRHRACALQVTKGALDLVLSQAERNHICVDAPSRMQKSRREIIDQVVEDSFNLCDGRLVIARCFFLMAAQQGDAPQEVITFIGRLL